MKIVVSCQTCGSPFEIPPSRIRHGRGKSCSPSCQHAAVAAKLGRKVTLTCIGCGKRFSRAPQHAGPFGKGKFCSRPCRDANRIGVLHPQYIDGARAARGPNWQAQKRKARKRDNRTCQHCGRPGQAVHHIRPYRMFDGDYVRANDLANLITLCAACHRIADAAIQADERAG